MKKTLIIFFSIITISLNAGTYYVSTTGSDSNPGTLASPWATWQKAISTATAGDTVYFRGGTYYPATKTYGYSIINYNPGGGYGNNGTYGNEIVYMAYPGETPILDGSLASSASPAGNYGIGMTGVDYVKFIGLTIRNVRQLALGGTIAGIYGGDCGNLTFDRITIHNISGEGLWIRGYDTLWVTNCDSYNNCDTLSDETHVAGGMGDGFLFSSRATSAADSVKTLYLTGCRAWNNTDDGFDMNVQETYVNQCWSWRNGLHSGNDYAAGGVGFKTNTGLVRIPTKKIWRNCITAYNQMPSVAAGAGLHLTNFEAGLGTIHAWYNNFSYRDERLTASYTPGDFDIDNFNNVLTNNIAYLPYTSYIASFDAAGANYQLYPYAHLTTNTFRIQSGTLTGRCETNPAYTVTADDFLSLDTAELRWPRQADGSLPLINFGKLADDSDLKGAGTDVGMSAVPDIGIDWAYLDQGIDSTQTGITSFILAEQTGTATIDTITGTPSVDITVAYGTDVTSLEPTITLDYGATVSPLSGASTDFTDPVTYTVTAINGVTTKEYTVTVTVAEAPPAPEVATVATTSASYTAVTANVTGRILSANGGTLTARGVCWSTTNTSPTTSDKHTTYLPYVGSFTDVIRGLRGNTTYYVRAYGTTSEGGTSYGDAISFTTDIHNVNTQAGKVLKQGGKIVIVK